MQSTEIVTEYKIGKATVRMHGTPDREKLEASMKMLAKCALLNERNKQPKGGDPDVLHG